MGKGQEGNVGVVFQDGGGRKEGYDVFQGCHNVAVELDHALGNPGGATSEHYDGRVSGLRRNWTCKSELPNTFIVLRGVPKKVDRYV